MLRDIEIGAFTVFGDIIVIRNAFLKQVMLNLLFNEIFVLIHIYCRFGDVFPGANPGAQRILRPFSGPPKHQRDNLIIFQKERIV